MNLFLKSAQRLARLPKVLRRADKLALAIFGSLTIVGALGLIRANYIGVEKIAAPGGSLTEGIVAESAAAVDREIETLTQAPLVAFDEKGQIRPALAASWKIEDEGRRYVFDLIEGFSSAAAAQTIKAQGSSLAQVEVAAPDEKTLELKLKQPFSPLLAELTKPIFDAGFYKITKRTNDKITLTARQSPLGRPFVETINIEVFTSQKALGDALAQERIEASVYPQRPSDRYQEYTFILPRRQMLFFNLSRDIFKDKKLRQKIKSGGDLNGLNFELTTVGQSKAEQTALRLIEEHTKRGAQVALRSIEQTNLEKEIITGRDHDALLLTVDFGRDPDPYSFWHSTQIESGQNIAAFSNKKADRLLEDARLTTDEAKRKNLYDELQKILEDEVPALFFDRETTSYWVRKKVKGIAAGEAITAADRFKKVNEWYIKTKRVKK